MSSPVCKLSGHLKLEIPNETDASPLKVATSTDNVAIQLTSVNKVAEELMKDILCVNQY
jgi:hypothetical protein